MRKSTVRLIAGRNGNVAVMAALALPACLGVLAVGVDYGHLTLERRELQVVADLAAIAVASDIGNAEAAVLTHLQNNSLDMVLKTQQGWKTPRGIVVPDDLLPATTGRMTIEKGRYVSNPSLSVKDRFRANAQPGDAVRVDVEQQGTLFFASMFTRPPLMSASGTAAITKAAAFSIGSRLASLEGGLINAILGRILGAKLSFTSVDYRALAAGELEIFQLTRGLATDLNLTTATYNDVLQAQITVPQLLAAISRYGGLPPSSSALVTTLRRALPSGGTRFSLNTLIDLGTRGRLKVNAGSNLQMKVGLLDLLQSSASLANGANLVSVQTQVALPGLGTVDLDLAIGEPALQTPRHRIGEPGQAVRTAQVRLGATIQIDGLAELLGVKIKLPIYVQVAHAEAKLADIRCHGGKANNATVGIDAVPGVAEIAIGTVDPSALRNFGSTPRVTKARLVDTVVLAVDGSSLTDVGSAQTRKLSFSPANIAAGLPKSVSSNGLTTSATRSLIGNLDVSIDLKVLSIALGSPKIVQAALAKSLGAVTPGLDTLLDSVLATAGVRVGEADIQVTNVDCANPVLVQ